MGEVVKVVVGLGVDVIDINMGCLVKKVIFGYFGLVLMWDLDYVLSLIEVIVEVVDVLVMLKMWLGWDYGFINVLEFVCRVEVVGV